jgi:hypothetical protein
MPDDPRNLHEQEQSIKAREGELYVKPLRAKEPRATKLFPDYLRKTSAMPLSSVAKTMIWISAILVGVIFLAALWRITHRRHSKLERKSGTPDAKVAVIFDAAGQTPGLDSMTIIRTRSGKQTRDCQGSSLSWSRRWLDEMSDRLI